jgi:thymidylate synthase ThyX
MDSKFAGLFEKSANFILDTYQKLFPKMVSFLKEKYPDAKEIEIKNKALDNLRYLLPVAVQTNLGMTINARNLEYGVVKLLSHPLDEMREIGSEIKEAALKVTPTLIKYTKPNEYSMETLKSIKGIDVGEIKNEDGAILVEFDKDGEDKLVVSLLYRFSKAPYKQIKAEVKSMSKEEKEKVIDEALKRLGKFDRPLREFENVVYTFDVLMDYGAFRDVQRHRICTQTNQEFTAEHGFDIPPEVKEAGMENEFNLCMNTAKEVYNAIGKELPDEAAYIIPLAYKKRLLMTMNLRELFHFIKLRSTKHGHESYRKIAWDMYDEIAKVHPVFAKYIEVTKTQ